MRAILCICTILFSMSAMADVVTKEITYNADVELKGFMAFPEGAENAPGILIVHEWWGHNQHSRDKAKEFAEAGFVAFALDMYGDGKSTQHPKEAKEFMMMASENQEKANKHFNQALSVFKKSKMVNNDRIGAVGYCFGGKVVLDQARQNQDLMGVVSIHGGLGPMENESKKKIRVPILVLHGEDDPMIGDETLVAFSREMTERKADYEFVSFPNALHGFTNPNATMIGKKYEMPLAYNEKADQKAHEKAIAFFNENAK